MKKNIFKILFSLFLVLGLTNISSAFTSYTPTVQCGYGDHYVFYKASGDLITSGVCGTSLTSNAYIGEAFGMEYNVSDVPNISSYPIMSMLQDSGRAYFVTHGWYLTGGGFSLTEPIETPSTNAGIFFPKDEITGNTTASLFTASVGDATETTVGSISPVLIIVLGIILAFVGINVVVGLIYGTDETKKKKKV